jgi:thioredoxin 1
MIVAMKTKTVLLLPLIILTAICFAQYAKAPLKIPATKPNLYPAELNAQDEIKHALSAAAPNKRVILVFGANWCGDCYALDYAFHQPRITPLLDANYKVVHVNVGKFDTNLDLAKKYSINLEKGIPNLAIIDSQEKVITSSPEFSKARVMTEDDVIDFLNKWKPGTK